MKSQYVVPTLMAIILSGCVVGTVSSPTPTLAVANAEERYDVDDERIFYDALEPHGTWIAHAEYHRVWKPRGVPRGWRPYTHGRWVYTDDGWTWISDWEWGWAPFHYGRWYRDARYDWVWVPGTVWAPSWVAWHHGSDWVGWAPLPPAAGWRRHGGISIDIRLDPTWFSFVRPRYLVEPRIYRHAAPVRQNVQLVRVTKNVTNYTIVNQRIVNRSIHVHDIERATRRPVRRFHVVETNSARVGGGGRLREREGQVAVYRPRVGRGSLDEELTRPFDRRSRSQALRDERDARPDQRRERREREQNRTPQELSRDERRQGQGTERDAERLRRRQERQDRQQTIQEQEPQHPGTRAGSPARERLRASPEDERRNRRQDAARPAPPRGQELTPEEIRQRQLQRQQRLDERQNRSNPQAQTPGTTRQNPGTSGAARSESRAPTRAERQEEQRSRQRQRPNEDDERRRQDQEDQQLSIPSGRSRQ